jgi:hypothetical protein
MSDGCMDAEQFLTQWIQIAERKTELLAAWADQCLKDDTEQALPSAPNSQRWNTKELIASLDQLCETVKIVNETAKSETISVAPNRDVGLSVVDVCQTLILGLRNLDEISADDFRKHIESTFTSIDTSTLTNPTSKAEHANRP